MGQQGVVWTRTADDRESGGTGEGLLTAMNGHSLESNRTVSLSLHRLDCGCTSSDRVDCGSKDCLAS